MTASPIPMYEQDAEGFYKIPADGHVAERHSAALHNILVARKLHRRYAQDYYSGYADALADSVARHRKKD